MKAMLFGLCFFVSLALAGAGDAQPSLEAAKREALAFCTKNNPHKECILYAVKIPD